ncbi:MAG: flagellar assembly protein FliH [Enterobacterales bacterium]|jgi:flagellar assembly protein FliH
MAKSKLTNIIPAEDIKHFERWSPPEVNGKTINAEQIDAIKGSPVSTTVNTAVTAQNAEEIRKAAYLEGLTEGKEEGRATGLKEQQRLVEQLNILLSQCQQQRGNFEQQLCDQLVELCISISKQVIRRELATEPEQIMAVIRESIASLPASSEKIIIKLHPEDAALVKGIYHLDDDPDIAWKIFEDPNMQRGGCIINTETSMINADLDNRIANIVSQLLGGERTDD